MRRGRLFQHLAIALIVVTTAVGTPADARASIRRHAITHFHQSGNHEASQPSSRIAEEHDNPWVLDKPAEKQPDRSPFNVLALAGLVGLGGVSLFVLHKGLSRRAVDPDYSESEYEIRSRLAEHRPRRQWNPTPDPSFRPKGHGERHGL